MNRLMTLVVAGASALSLFAGDITLKSGDYVKDSDNAIQAIIGIREATVKALADKDAKVTVMPLAEEGVKSERNKAVNREMQWLIDGKRTIWGGKATVKPNEIDHEAGSHLWRTEGRGDKMRYWWYERMKERQQQISESNGEFDIVVGGDSITHWCDRGNFLKPFQDDFRKTYKVLNAGYGGDHAESLLWRFKHGELDGFKTKVITIMIGTNNQGKHDTVESTASAIKEAIAVAREKQPQAKILLMAIFPRLSPKLTHMREKSAKVSDIIKGYADGKNVIWLDLRYLFEGKDGEDRFDLLTDGTHPTVSGMRAWRDALLPYFEKYTGKKHIPVDVKQEPCKRIWIRFGVNFAEEGSVKAVADFAKKAKKAGYNGLCIDGFNGEAAFKANAAKAFDACRKVGVEPIAVVRNQEIAKFEEAIKSINESVKPAKYFIATNGTETADIEAFKKSLTKEQDAIKKVNAQADITIDGTPIYSRMSGSVKEDTLVASYRDFAYFHKNKRDTMIIVPIERLHPGWELHEMFEWFRKYPNKGEKSGIVYWTDKDDYHLMQSAAKIANARE